jgi:hypothetical protein
MKPLVFTCCYGSETFVRMLEIWLDSVRMPGGYNGEIMVFTDIPDKLKHLDAEIIERPPINGHLDCFWRKAQDIGSVNSMDAVRALYSDVDCIFTQPLNRFFETQANVKRLCVALGNFSIGHKANAGHFNRQAQVEATLPGFNCGLCIFESNEKDVVKWTERAEEIRRNWASNPPPLGDQSVLNYLQWTKEIDAYAIPRKWVAYPENGDDPHAVEVGFVHFVRAAHERRATMMRECLGISRQRRSL